MKQKLPSIPAKALIVPSSIDRENKTFDVVYASENPVFRSGWDYNYNEVLRCTPESVMLNRFDNNAVPLLDVHSKYRVDDQYGKVTNPRFENGQLLATVHFSRQDKKADIWKDIEAGIITSFSAGYRIWAATKDESTNPVTITATRWEAVELSLAPVPADFKSQTRSTEQEAFYELDIETLNTNRTDMSNESQTAAEQTAAPAATAATAAAPANPVDNTRAQVKAERERVTAITKVVENARSKGYKLDETFLNELIEGERTLADAKALVLDKISEMEPTIGQRNAGVNVVIAEDEKDKIRTAMSDAIIHRADPGSVKLEDKAHDFKGMRLVDMARHFVGEEMGGLDKTYRLNESELVHRAIATTDYPDLLTSTVNRQLRRFFNAAPQNWKPLANQTSVADFRAKTGVQVDGKIDFDVIPQNGEYKRAKMGTSKASIQVDTYGKMISISRQSIINDDLDAFKRVPQLFGTGASNKQSELIWNLLLSGKTPDNKTIFHADHANLAASGSALTETSLNAAFIAIYKQLSPEKEVLALTPKFLVVPVELEMAARKILSNVTAPKTGDVNTFANSLTLIVEPRLSIMAGGSATSWYVAADPSTVEGLMYAYLNGDSGLFTESRTNFNDDSVDTKARFEFGVAAWDYRGWYKNPGA